MIAVFPFRGAFREQLGPVGGVDGSESVAAMADDQGWGMIDAMGDGDVSWIDAGEGWQRCPAAVGEIGVNGIGETVVPWVQVAHSQGYIGKLAYGDFVMIFDRMAPMVGAIFSSVAVGIGAGEISVGDGKSHEGIVDGLQHDFGILAFVDLLANG